jgi:hypothetical protein
VPAEEEAGAQGELHVPEAAVGEERQHEAETGVGDRAAEGTQAVGEATVPCRVDGQQCRGGGERRHSEPIRKPAHRTVDERQRGTGDGEHERCGTGPAGR